ncbi:hypothetical protein DQ384_04990 [Sphaerisporangium album]|uniref:Uncharacterized protein n=1 Tax=Sphaerisporangium album TaxID=509200 RepID=A0A367FRG8_9ACTN|nr:hypothetical protein [Sphaerisporangium album]RCG32824.1 hypothetical protein DQ384_04990 [Sphaerisporangium album]
MSRFIAHLAHTTVPGRPSREMTPASPARAAFWSYTKRLTDWKHNLTRAIVTRPPTTERRRR